MLSATGPGELAGRAVGPFTEELLYHHYPRLSGMLEQAGILLPVLNSDTDMLQAAHRRIHEELQDIIRQEQNALFPLLLQLEADRRVLETCTAFTAVRGHYNNLLQALRQLKLQLGELARDLGQDETIRVAGEHIRRFEHELVSLQNTKEQHLYSPFRNCSNHCQKTGI